MQGKDKAILDRIREARRKCGNGVKMLPVVHYERKLWFLDKRLRQLRNIRNPHDSINLNDFEIEYFKGRWFECAPKKQQLRKLGRMLLFGCNPIKSQSAFDGGKRK